MPSSDGCLQAFKVYNIKGEILAGPVSLVDFFGHSVTGSFSDAACKECFNLGVTTLLIAPLFAMPLALF